MVEDQDEGARVEGTVSRVNRILVDGFGVRSAEELSELTGIPAGEVAKRQQEIYSSIDKLTIAEKRAKLILQLEDLVAELNDRVRSSSDRNAAALANAARGSVATVLKELERMERADRADIEAINVRRAHELRSLVEGTFFQLLGRLEERFPEADVVEVEAEFLELLSAQARRADGAV